MFKIIGAHFRKVGRKFRANFESIAAGIENDDPALRQQGINGLVGLIIPRLIAWVPYGIYCAIRGGVVLQGYIEFIGIFYIVVAMIAAATPAPEAPPEKEEPTSPSDDVVMKHAREGLPVLLDYIFLVCESLAEQTEIFSPKTKEDLAWPDMKRCIGIEDGVAVITVSLDHTGELDPAKFMGRFNERMAKKLSNGQLPGNPPAVFTDADNEPHTAIQAIRCIPFKEQKRLRLEVIRVNQAAVALLDKVARESASGADGSGGQPLYDDTL